MSVKKVNKTDGSLTLLAGSTNFSDNPIGTILPYGGSTVPTGWLLCDGSAVSRTTYSDLFGVIGTSFGAGNGSTTFNIPDMRESVPKGAGLTGHTVGAHLDADGLAVGEFLDDRVQEHQHSIEITGSDGTSVLTSAFAYEQTSNGSGNKWNRNVSTNNTGRYGATTEVKSVGVNYIIKAKMCAMPSDFMNKVDEAVEEYLSWKTLTSDLGTDWVDLPTTYNELHVAIYSTTWNGGNDMVIVDKSDKVHCLTAYLSATNYIYGLVQIQNNQIKKGMNGGVFGGGSVSDVKVTVRYR